MDFSAPAAVRLLHGSVRRTRGRRPRAALARRAFDEFGRIDTWVNNAAVSAYATFRDTPAEDFRQILEVNVMGQVHGAKAALPYLEESGGALVCTGSVESDRGMPPQSAYAASKHAIKGWLDALRVELRKAGSPVRVSLIKPLPVGDGAPRRHRARGGGRGGARRARGAQGGGAACHHLGAPRRGRPDPCSERDAGRARAGGPARARAPGSVPLHSRSASRHDLGNTPIAQ